MNLSANPGGNPDYRLEANLRQDLCRLARFGANISDAHSCFIFLPTPLLSFSDSNLSHQTSLSLIGHHSLSSNIVVQSMISIENGIIGWVSKHNRSIHVSPFERDSRTLGVYATDEQLKSFLGIPVPFTRFSGASLVGVIACDSKRSFAFSKLQGKLVEDLANEVSNTVELLSELHRHGAMKLTWNEFLGLAEKLSQALGRNSIEVFRLKLLNFDKLEAEAGTRQALEQVEQVFRLIQQSLAPHYPSLQLPNGELIIILDNMMASFYENKVKALCQHVQIDGRSLNFEFSRKSLSDKRYRTLSIESLINLTSFVQPNQGAQVYEYRRA